MNQSNYSGERPEMSEFVDGIVEMAAKLSQRQTYTVFMTQAAVEDLAQEMIVSAIQAWRSWDPTRGDWWARCHSVMSWTASRRIDSPLSISRRPAHAARRAAAFDDQPDEMIERLVAEGTAPDAAHNLVNNLGSGLPWRTDGTVSVEPTRYNVPPQGRQVTSVGLQSQIIGSEDCNYQLIELEDLLVRFSETLNERENMIWHFHLEGSTGQSIAASLELSPATVSLELKALKQRWNEFCLQ